MIAKLVMWIGKKAINKYILGGAVALLLGGAGLFWHNFKQDLRDEGKRVCVQVINEETVLALQDALAAERATATRLATMMVAAAKESEQARARLRESKSKMDALSLARKEQEKTDETYATWSNAPLPDGVADRLRDLFTGRDENPSTDDSN